MSVLPNSLAGESQAVLLCESATHRYGVWYSLTNEVLVGKQSLSGGAWETFQIAGAARTALACPITNDEHNYPSIAIDGLGKLHVWANMHNNALRYIRSTNAEDITAWGAATMPGGMSEYTYPWPMPRPDGSMRFIMRADPSTSAGSGAADTYYWDMGAASSTFGSPVKLFQGLSVPNAKGPGIAGDPVGSDTIYNWSCYFQSCTLATGVGDHYVDHFFGTWREQSTGAPDPERTNVEPFYVQYRSATNSWHTITGTTVTLPFDPINSTAIQMGLVSGGEGYINFQGMTVDPVTGWPWIILSRSPYYMIFWTGSAWFQAALPNPLNLHSWTFTGPINPVWMNGNLWYLVAAVDEGRRKPVLVRADGAAHVVMGGDIPGLEAWSPSINPTSYMMRGAVDVLTPRGNAPRAISCGRGFRANVL